MKLVSEVLLKTDQGYGHWCVACKKLHIFDQRWTFNDNLDAPTFFPSMKTVTKWEHTEVICHYFLTNGVQIFCDDTAPIFKKAGLSVPLEPIPAEWRPNVEPT